jgi:hypothetical protein
VEKIYLELELVEEEQLEWLQSGAIAGGAFGAATYSRSYVNRNRDFFQQSPYNRGSAMQAASTSAYGDMVLGMHNSRRG